MARVSEPKKGHLAYWLPVVMALVIVVGLGAYIVATPTRYEVSSKEIVQITGTSHKKSDLTTIRSCTRNLTAEFSTDHNIQAALAQAFEKQKSTSKLDLYIPPDSPAVEIIITTEYSEIATEAISDVKNAVNRYIEQCNPQLEMSTDSDITVQVEPSSDDRYLGISCIAIALLAGLTTHIVVRYSQGRKKASK